MCRSFIKGFDDLRNAPEDGLRWADRFDNRKTCNPECNQLCDCYVNQEVPTYIFALNDPARNPVDNSE